MEHRMALFGHFHHHFSRWQLQLSARQGMVEGKILPFLPALALEYEPAGWLVLKMKINQNYRFPTLNDRYWQPGGNPDLLPERGWSQELGVDLNWSKDQHHFHYAITGYNRHIKDWIRWSPDEETRLWTAQNIALVWSRGIEQRLGWQWPFRTGHMTAEAGHDLVHSTNQVTVSELGLVKGEQLVYVPVHQAFARLSMKWRKTRFQYLHRYTGPITTVVEPLPGYQVAGVRLEQGWEGRWLQGLVFLNIENLWNEPYRVVERRVMPGRHYRVGVRLDFRQEIAEQRDETVEFKKGGI